MNVVKLFFLFMTKDVHDGHDVVIYVEIFVMCNQLIMKHMKNDKKAFRFTGGVHNLTSNNCTFEHIFDN